MELGFLTHGFDLGHIALAVQRVAVGSFFAISGYHKLTNTTRHAALIATLEKDKVPAVWFNQWWVPSWECIGGFAVAVGFASAFAASVLTFICVVACMTEAKARVEAYKPIDWADMVDDYLYLPEVLYIIMLLVVVLGGGGSFSADAIVK